MKDGAGDTWVPRLLWPTTTNFPTFDAFYFHKAGDVYALQMTIAVNHGLKNNGALQTQKYLDGIKAAKPYKAVFVVPHVAPGDIKKCNKRQPFEGNVTNGKTKVMDAAKATPLMNKSFKQYVIEVE